MANALSRTYEADGQEITLNPATVARYILSNGSGPVSEPEMAKVIMTCAARKLNPFAGDVHIMPHYDSGSGTTRLTVCPSIDFFMRRAMSNPRFRGIEDGITVLMGGNLVKKRGSAVYKETGEVLVGGWAAVYVEGFDKPVFSEVALSEYTTGRALWKTKPGTMVNKVAKSQALRKAFPDDFQGLYTPDEMGQEAPNDGGRLEVTTAAYDIGHDSPMALEADGYEISAGEDKFRDALPAQEGSF